MPKFMSSFGESTKAITEQEANNLEDETNNESVSISPMYDFAFRIWMNDKLVCGEFLEAVLGRKVEILEIETQTDIAEALPELRGIRLDIKAIGKDFKGRASAVENIEIYDVESQRIHYTDNRERCVFYASRLLSTQLKAGDDFSNLKRTTIVFVNMESLKRDKFLQSASLRFDDRPEEAYYEKLQIVELNLDKLQGFQDDLYSKESISGNSREEKLDFFASFCLIGDKETAFRAFYEERKFEFDQILEKLNNAFRLLRNDKEVKEQVKEYIRKHGEVKEVTTMRLSDQIRKEGIEQGIEQGIERGIEQGIERGICVLIQDNLEENIPVSRILLKLQKWFSLSEEKAQFYFDKFSK